MTTMIHSSKNCAETHSVFHLIRMCGKVNLTLIVRLIRHLFLRADLNLGNLENVKTDQKPCSLLYNLYIIYISKFNPNSKVD